MPPPVEKMWKTQYMDNYNKRRAPVRRTKPTPTVAGRYNNPHPKKDFLEPSNLSYIAPPSYFIMPSEYGDFDMYNNEFSLQTTAPSIPFYTAYDSNLSINGKKAPMSAKSGRKSVVMEEIITSDKRVLAEDTGDIPQKVPTPPKEERTFTPAPELHWSCWPEPGDLPKRPHTVLGIHHAPPVYDGTSGDDIEDRPNSTEPSYVFGVNEESARGPPMTFVPELQSWVNATTDYDKEAAETIMAMNGTLAPPLPPQALRPQRQATFTFGSTRGGRSSAYQPILDPRNHYSMSWKSFNDTANRKLAEEKRIRDMDRKMLMCESLPQIPQLQRSNTDMRPMQRRVIRYPRGEDYIHEHSMFMTTQPLVRGHFIIHPDWVSERTNKKRINLANPPFRNEFRYGTTYSSEY